MAKIKPFYKLNNGNGATLCNTCKVVISEGFTEDLYCKKCDPEQETLEKYSERFDNTKSEIGNPDTWGKRVIDKHKQEAALKEALLELRKTPMTFEPKQETLEEAAETSAIEQFEAGNNAYILGFKLGAKWQEEKMYSEEDMRNAFDSAREFNSLDGVVDIHIVLPMGGDMSDLQPLHFTFEEFIEQFKKK